VENFVHDSPETQAIRQRMEEVRGDLNTGFQGIVNEARDIGDWTYYVKTYPWAVLGVSLVAGYLIAPRLGFGLKPQTEPPDVVSDSNRSNSPTSKGSVSGRVLSFVGHLVVRGVTAYLLQHADRLFESKSIKPDPIDHNEESHYEKSHS
jgi:hypothetical protein